MGEFAKKQPEETRHPKGGRTGQHPAAKKVTTPSTTTPTTSGPSTPSHMQRQLGNAITTAASRRHPTSRKDRPSPTARSTARIDQGAGKSEESEEKISTPFRGWAATADIRAAKAAAEAGGISPIKVSPAYAEEQVERKERQMDFFRHEDIPFIDDNMNHYAYKKLIELRQEYVEDVTRITLAEGAFNKFVVPATMAIKSNAQFKTVERELGYEGLDPLEDLNKKQRRAIAKGIDADTLGALNQRVTDKESISQGLREQILGASFAVQAAMQKRAGLLAVEAKEKGEKEKQEIQEKITAVKDGFETATKVIETISFIGFGAPEAIEGIGEGGTKGIKSGLELGGKGVTLVGSTVEFIMQQMYREQIEKAKQEIEKAKLAETYARKMDAQLSLDASMYQISGLLDQLAGEMGELSLALRDRKNYFAKIGADIDKASGSKGGSVSQYLLYVSQAYEIESFIHSADAAAVSSAAVMKAQISEMAKHRNYTYVADKNGVWDDRARIVDGEGPDLAQLRVALKLIEDFREVAQNQLLGLGSVIGSLTVWVMGRQQ